ncbi:acetyl-CoA C-acetyltransferase [Thermotomaculum hydrothermale]|uniref:Acetyl-CoA C-acetyltransferase n=1 Tax=Thermotomaculum hydrothermale TaxID=981385 RepID=A0A7R6PG23_9BACT|nr:acetyl-CoA C-acetyltransferase [Thermotomaculum hydrothermale]BBB33079.1 acetyl-CoA C-acetyltransferase [Thermotomaculum hydrothermale]
MGKPVIVGAVRTPIGRFMGGLSSLRAPELGSIVIKEAVKRTGINVEEIDEVVMGNVVQAGIGQNPARQAAIFAGLPVKIPSLTVNKVCGSGLRAIMLAAQTIKAGDTKLSIAGGMESMSNCPYLLDKARIGYRLGNGVLIDSMVHDGLWDIYNDYHMGITAELVAEKYGITREQQDEYAYNSQMKAVNAIKSGAFKDEIVPVEVPQRKGDPVVIDTDEGPRADTTMEKLAKLRPAFKKDGTVTAGNASTINDGAAVCVVADEDYAKENNLPIRARIVDYAVSGLEPQWVMLTPIPAIKMLWEKTGWKNEDVDLYEINEAFAVQLVAVIDELKLDPAKVNVNGGAVALGHPIGASGARLMVTMLNALEKRNLKRGIVALCLGGGNAVAMAIERV